MTPDVNILVAASREDHPHHTVASKWLRSAVAEGNLALLPMVATSFIRIVTNAKIFPTPTPPRQALHFIDAILAAASTSKFLTLSGEWEEFNGLVDEAELVGNAIPDAWIAAAVTRHGDHLVTFDRGFRKLLRRSRLTVLKT
jgi:uncharacterized protein